MENRRVWIQETGTRRGEEIKLGRFPRRYLVNLSLPSEIFASPFEHFTNAPEEIRHHYLIKDFSYFYAWMPFSVIPLGKHTVNTITLDVTIFAADKELPGQIPSYFPVNDFKPIGEVSVTWLSESHNCKI